MDAGGDGLPDWLRQIQSSQPQGAGQTYQHAGGYSPAQPQPQAQAYGGQAQQFSAGSLVSEDALPEWLRAVGQVPAAPQQPRMSWDSGAAGAGWNGTAQANGYPQGYPAQQGAGQGMGYGAAQPAPATSAPLSYGQPANALFDEAAIPDWLREASKGHEIDPQPQSPLLPSSFSPQAAPYTPGFAGQAQPQPAAQSASSAFPSIDQAGMHQLPPPSPAGLAGNALLDPGALPQWLGGQQAASGQLVGQANPGGMAAQSLIDESALPQWLRAEPNAPSAPAPSYYAPGAPAPTVSGRFAASANAEPLPAWLNQVYADANVARIEQPPAPVGWNAQPAPPSQVPAAGMSAARSGGGLSAGGFVDESALPEWLRSQGAMESPAAPPAPPLAGRVAPQYVPPAGGWAASTMLGASGQFNMEQPAAQGPSGHFAASDLIDPSALPSWVSGQEAAAPPSFSSTSGWTSRQPAVPLSNQAAAQPAQFYEPAQPAWGAAEPQWDDGAQLNWNDAPPQPFRADHDPHFGSPLDLDDYSASEWQAPAPPAPRRGPDPRVGERAQDSGRRRGAPIPTEELPPWLQRGGPVPGMQGGQMQAPAPRGGYGAPQHGGRGGPYDEYDAGDWEAMPPGGEQWSSWDESQYGDDAGYDAAFADYPPPDADQQGRRPGGWRRIFGRK